MYLTSESVSHFVLCYYYTTIMHVSYIKLRYRYMHSYNVITLIDDESCTSFPLFSWNYNKIKIYYSLQSDGIQIVIQAILGNNSSNYLIIVPLIWVKGSRQINSTTPSFAIIINFFTKHEATEIHNSETRYKTNTALEHKISEKLQITT